MKYKSLQTIILKAIYKDSYSDAYQLILHKNYVNTCIWHMKIKKKKKTDINKIKDNYYFFQVKNNKRSLVKRSYFRCSLKMIQ